MLDLLAQAAKAVTYLGILGAVGVTLARRSLFWGRPRSSATGAGLVRAMGVALASASAANAVLYVLRLGGAGDVEVLSAIFMSLVGVVLALQIGSGLWFSLDRTGGSAAIPALMALASIGIVGHAAADGVGAAILVVVHVAAACWWFGALCLLFLESACEPADGLRVFADKFSAQAIRVVVSLVVGGIGTAALLLEFRYDLSQPYSVGLSAKAALTLMLLAIAAVNKFWLTRRLDVDPHARPWLRRTIALELALIVGIVMTTAYITTNLSPPRSMRGEVFKS